MIHIQKSSTVRLNDIAAQKKQQGQKIYNFGAGEIQTDISQFLEPALRNLAIQKLQPYTPTKGLPALRAKACQWMNKSWNTNFSRDEILVTCGGKYAIFLSLQSLLDAGDEVLCASPYWVSYPAMTEILNAKFIPIPTSVENKFCLTASEIEKYCTSKTKILILNNAGNPTGNLYSSEQIREILELCQKKNIFVISDEVYSGLVYDQKKYISCGSFPEFSDRVLIVQSVSKNFALMGTRVGFVAGHLSIIERIEKLQSHTISGTSSIAQYFVSEILENSADIMEFLKQEMQKKRDIFAQNFYEIFRQKLILPESGIYFFVPMNVFKTPETDSLAFCETMVEQSNTVMIPGKAFGQEGWLRMSFGGNEKDFKMGFSMMKKVLLNKKVDQ
jgi:aspartate/methionine/tyrosine aminotransferase